MITCDGISWTTSLFPLEWSEQRVGESIALFDRRGVGLWLAYEKESGELAGFCGFLEIPSIHPEPQLVYALFERFTASRKVRQYASVLAPGLPRLLRTHGPTFLITRRKTQQGSPVRTALPSCEPPLLRSRLRRGR